MMEHLFEVVISIGISFLAGKYMSLSKERNALKGGLQAMLRDRLTQSSRYFIKRGHIGRLEKINLVAMYKAYHDLGKNGVMDETYRKILVLPEDEEE